MFYLTMQSSHFVWLYGVGHMVKDNSEEKPTAANSELS